MKTEILIQSRLRDLRAEKLPSEVVEEIQKNLDETCSRVIERRLTSKFVARKFTEIILLNSKNKGGNGDANENEPVGLAGASPLVPITKFFNTENEVL